MQHVPISDVSTQHLHCYFTCKPCMPHTHPLLCFLFTFMCITMNILLRWVFAEGKKKVKGGNRLHEKQMQKKGRGAEEKSTSNESINSSYWARS